MYNFFKLLFYFSVIGSVAKVSQMKELSLVFMVQIICPSAAVSSSNILMSYFSKKKSKILSHLSVSVKTIEHPPKRWQNKKSQFV